METRLSSKEPGQRQAGATLRSLRAQRAPASHMFTVILKPDTTICLVFITSFVPNIS